MINSIGGILDGIEGKAIAELSAEYGRPILWLVEDEIKATRALSSLNFFAPRTEALYVPAYDCLPYDSFSPSVHIAAMRTAALARIAKPTKNMILIASLASAMQKVPPQDSFPSLEIKAGGVYAFSALETFLAESGYQRVELVANEGEYAVRGGIIDVYPANSLNPVRLDFLGDEIESLRLFDSESQMSLEKIESIELYAASEVIINPKTQKRFQQAYIDEFGFAPESDLLYAAITAGRSVKGVEQYLPLFYPRLETIFTYLKEAILVYNESILSLAEDREIMIKTCYEGRLYSKQKALAPDRFYLTDEKLQSIVRNHTNITLSPFEAEATPNAKNYSNREAYNFSTARATGDKKIMEEVKHYIDKSTKPIWLAAATPVQSERIESLFEEWTLQKARTLDEARQQKGKTLSLIPLDIERGIETDESIIFCEEDILGKRTRSRRRRRRLSRSGRQRRDELLLAEALQPGDLITHRDHGIGRFVALTPIEVAGAKHDCLLIHYAAGDRLYVPVENTDLISRYGGGSEQVALDRLGSSVWQTRKERVQKRLWEMAGELITLAAKRQTALGNPLTPQAGLYEEFVAGFGFEETPDQAQAIEDVLTDLSKGKIMDRLICGDVGFGKTEVALRTAFIQAMSGKQVAVIVPTTLLCRQHYENFRKRFENFPLRVGQLSRLVSVKEKQEVRQVLADGTLDIVIGTHFLLSESMAFNNLGLVIVDEEQHFGVQHKERLKEIRDDVHILTLTATPIPRTLQLALSGAREVSLIGDAPLGRLAVHSFIGAFDPMTTSQALIREKKRGGQSFFICPRIKNLEEAENFLLTHTPGLRVAVAHGRLAPQELEEQIGIFYDGAADVLLSTHIVEAGIDIANANTLVVWHAHQFGLAQLHQLRGRIGRGKKQGYAYFTLPPDLLITRQAEERLHALQATQFLGAGFSLAARDLDARGAGNLLGRDQSGHIKEIGYELYQRMLAEAVEMRQSNFDKKQESFSPRIHLPVAIMIPESYIPDMQVRLTLYRRIAQLDKDEELIELQAEIEDRFGSIPKQLTALFWTLRLKVAAKSAGVEELDLGKQLGLRFYKNKFDNLKGLVALIESLGTARLMSDHRLLIKLEEQKLDEKLQIGLNILQELGKLKREEHGNGTASRR